MCPGPVSLGALPAPRPRQLYFSDGSDPPLPLVSFPRPSKIPPVDSQLNSSSSCRLNPLLPSSGGSASFLLFPGRKILKRRRLRSSLRFPAHPLAPGRSRLGGGLLRSFVEVLGSSCNHTQGGTSLLSQNQQLLFMPPSQTLSSLGFPVLRYAGLLRSHFAGPSTSAPQGARWPSLTSQH